MNYNWVQTFWNSLTNIDARNWIEMVLTIGASVVTAWATYQIMKSNSNQTKIAEQKRKDDLFKIRWEFYKEEILIELEKIYLEATKQYSSEEELYYQMEESEFLKNTGLSKKQHKEIQHLLSSGIHRYAIARQYGCTHNAINRYIKKHNLIEPVIERVNFKN
jgi:hypothetical protein